MKRWFPVLVLGAMLAVGFSTPLQAQQAPTQQAFSLSAANQSSAVIQFSSPISSCGVVVYNGGTFTLVPQSSNDGTTWVTATGINSGSISATGSYTGGVANTGLKSFRVLLTAVDSTPVTGLITCSNALARVSGGGGPTPTPFVPSTPAAGNCIGISTPPAAGTIAYTCASPTPFPAVTATACAASPNFAGSTLSIPAGCQPSPVPSPQVTATACGAGPSVGAGGVISIGTSGCSSGGGGGGPAFSVVQYARCIAVVGGSGNCTATLPQAAAASGNTLLGIFAHDGASTFTLPSGFSSIASKASGDNCNVVVAATAPTSGQTAVTATTSGGDIAGAVVELTGTRTLDTSNGVSVAGTNPWVMPTLTTGAASLVFYASGNAITGAGGTAPLPLGVGPLGISTLPVAGSACSGASNCRDLGLTVSPANSGSFASVVSMYDITGVYSSCQIATLTFSIK